MKTRAKTLLLVPVLAFLLAGCEGGEFARSIQLTNQYREAHGVHVVLNNATLQAKAQNWAEVLAAEGRLVHSNLAEGAGGGWHALGENLAMASSIDEAQQLFVNSPSHPGQLPLQPGRCRSGHPRWALLRGAGVRRLTLPPPAGRAQLISPAGFSASRRVARSRGR